MPSAIVFSMEKSKLHRKEQINWRRAPNLSHAQSLLSFVASKFSAVLHTSIASPSPYLIDSILAEKCYEAKSPLGDLLSGEESMNLLPGKNTCTLFKQSMHSG